MPAYKPVLPLFIALVLAQSAHAAGGPAACEALKAAGTFNFTTVTSAKIVAADAGQHLPAFCEVTAAVKPVKGSNITMVYRLPEGWNGKLLGLGGGGWAGNMLLRVAAPGLANHYATAQTDAGHFTADMDDITKAKVWDTAWSANPESVTDFQYRAIHLMTDLGKQVVAKYYGEPQKRAYFQGCSTGGRQALMEVQRFPKDYDGIIAGAPVYTLATQTTSIVRNQILASPDASLSEAQLKRVNDAALAACDGRDGLADGVINEPQACPFDPAAVQCAEGRQDVNQDASCLSAAQVKVLHKLYSATKNSAGDTVAYPLTRGSELSWSRFLSTAAPTTRENFLTGPAGAGIGGLRPLLFGDANYDLPAFNPERDFRVIRKSAFAAGYEARDPDISPFLNNGGKLLLWHGMDDPGPSVQQTIEYYQQMARTTGPKVKSLDTSARFFVLPGVYHCRGGPGASEFDSVAAMDQWVEHGQAPNMMKATRVDGPAMSRPVCQYPTMPRYNGKGDPHVAESFQCR
jgi:feruloyl esterase